MLCIISLACRCYTCRMCGTKEMTIMQAERTMLCIITSVPSHLSNVLQFGRRAWTPVPPTDGSPPPPPPDSPQPEVIRAIVLQGSPCLPRGQ